MKTWAETIQDCIEIKWQPELNREIPDMDMLTNKCGACYKAEKEAHIISRCSVCPVAIVSGKKYCDNTPFRALNDLWVNDLCEDKDNLIPDNVKEIKGIIQEEINFLETVKLYCDKEGI